MNNLPYAVRQYVELRQEASRHFAERQYQECQIAQNVAAQYWRNMPRGRTETGRRDSGGATVSTDLDSLRPYYRMEQHGSKYHIYCKACGQGWSLPAENIKIGAILKLLDHAHSHTEEEKQP